MTHAPHRHRRAVRIGTAVAGLSFVGASLLTGAATSATAGEAGGTDATFPGTGFGAIADGGSGCGPSPGAARDVTFDVSGMPARGLSDVRINALQLSPAHQFVGDLVVTLIAPNSASGVLFGRTGAATAAAFGDGSNVAGPYTFADDAAGGWWAAAAAAAETDPIPPGFYRTSAIGGAGGTGANTSLTLAFSGVSDPNGTWTLRFTDGCQGDVGSVSAATLGLTSTPPICTSQQEAVTNAQTAVTSANAAVASAQTAANAADAAVTQPQASATQAQTAATAARAAADKASAAVTKAKAAVKKAKRSGSPTKVKKAKKKLKAAKAALKAANASLVSANASLVSANAALAAAKSNAAAKQQVLANAKAAQTTANAQLVAAQAALTACQAS